MSLKGTWNLEIGYGGWVRFTGPQIGDAQLYVRIRYDNGRPVPTEVYLDGGSDEVEMALVRNLPLSGLVAWADEWADHIDRGAKYAGPNLSTLASYFATVFGTQANHWVADQWRAQIKGSGVKDPGPAKPKDRTAVEIESSEEPPPLGTPDMGITDAFLRSIAANYRWAVARRIRPAPFIAQQMGEPDRVRTVQGWIARARDRGHLPPVKKGSVS